MYLTPSFVIASIVLYGLIGAAGIAVGTRLSERASPSPAETFSARFAIPIANEDELAAYRRYVDVGSVEADVDRAERAPQSFAMRFGLVELLPFELTQFATDEAASLRASLEAVGAAAIGAIPVTAASAANPASHRDEHRSQ
jgi:hypothetical protein